MNPTRKSKKELLRQKAEKLLSKKSPTVSKIENRDIKRLVHELQVHRVELEMQNEELRRAQADIEESRTKYSDLYDFAPVGYFTFSHAGEIMEVNLMGATLMGIDRTKLLRREFSTFVDPGFRSLFRDHRLNVLKTGGRERCELKLTKKDGKSFLASIESISVRDGRNRRIRSAVSDITELKKTYEKAETEHAFRIAIENSILSGIAAVDPEGRQSYVNPGFCRMVGRSEEELLGKRPPFAYWPPEESDHISRAFQMIMGGRVSREGLELRFMRKNGDRFDALVLPSPLKDHQGKIIGWIGSFGDITHIKQMEKELIRFNTQLEERVRQRSAELETANEQLRQEITKRNQMEEQLRKSQGELEIRVQERTAEVMEAVEELQDEMSERKRAEEALRESQAHLRHLSTQLLTMQESERRRIARDLHDGVGQMLTAVKFQIESSLQLESNKKSLEAVIPLLRESIEEVRRVQMDLRPSTLDDLGILATLDWFCREYQKIYTHIQIEKKTDLKESDVPAPLKTVIYRVTQEALNNIAKHSQATLVRLYVGKKENRIELMIEDNGAGFDLEEVLSPDKSRRGLGLASMRERTQLSDGSFLIESTPGKGTTIRTLWPL